MVCGKCGKPCQGDYCAGCEQVQRCKDTHGLPDGPEGDEWRVDQQGLGDRDAEGQATLNGGIRKESEANE